MRKVLINSQGKALLYDSKFLAVQDGLLPTGHKRLTGIQFDGNCYYDTGLYLHGSDTIRFSFAASKACNVLGCYTTADAQTNYSLYVSTTSGSKYLRYNGGTYNSYIATNTRYNVVGKDLHDKLYAFDRNDLLWSDIGETDRTLVR